MSNRSSNEPEEMLVVKSETLESQRFLCEFIEMYRTFPCLWKYSCKDYRNKMVKEKAYACLLEKMREVDPRADKNSVMRKINALRTAFRREFKKVRRAASIARHTGNKYPKKKSTQLWYYDLLKFVVDEQNYCIDPPPGSLIQDWCTGEGQPEVSESFTAVDEDGKVVGHSAETLMEFLEDTPSIQQTEIKVEPSSPLSSRANSPGMMPTSSSGPILNLEIDAVYSEKSSNSTRRDEGSTLQEPPPLAPISRTPATRRLQTMVPPVVPHQQMEPESADFDRFGAYVASKLRRSSRKQSIIAEKVIAEVLMRANLGTLEETTMLTDIKVPSPLV